jgi:uncharacterized DUF497 family protein
MRFKWIAWNRAHLARHGVSQREAEEVVWSPKSKHRVRKDGTVVTIGTTRKSRRLFVVWREEEATDIFADLESWVFVITAYEV